MANGPWEDFQVTAGGDKDKPGKTLTPRWPSDVLATLNHEEPNMSDLYAFFLASKAFELPPPPCWPLNDNANFDRSEPPPPGAPKMLWLWSAN